MRKCKNCGTMLDDDELFCHECGTKQEIEEVEAQPEPESEPESEPEPAKAEEPAPEPEPSVQEPSEPEPPAKEQEPREEEPVEEDEEKKKSKAWAWILLALLAGGVIWWYLGDGFGGEYAAAETPETDSVEAVVEANEQNAEGEPTDDLLFLDQFYKKFNDEDYLLSHITTNVKNKLRRDYEYDCYSNDCLAIWVFTAYPAGADLDLVAGPIITPTDYEGRYKADFKYSYYDGNVKSYETRSVYLSVTEIDGKFLISDYEVIREDKELDTSLDFDDEDMDASSSDDDENVMESQDQSTELEDEIRQVREEIQRKH